MNNYLKGIEEFIADDGKLSKIRKNKKQVENAFLAFYRANIFHHRLSYKSFFAKELVQLWELYLSELQIALSYLEEHEKKFLEDCYLNKLDHKNMFFSRANYYSCLNKYSDKFLALFDYEFFHQHILHLRKVPKSLLFPFLVPANSNNSQTQEICFQSFKN